uniref:Peptidase S1 domain-containing protein n=1 Tax=Timema bartmani TaxID=61472 RepID=A0A7R9F7B8_9NEOP|nr:unnamed protein product [Timema bartmani]
MVKVGSIGSVASLALRKSEKPFNDKTPSVHPTTILAPISPSSEVQYNVSTPFVFSNNVQPVGLASNNLNLAGGTYTKVAGWGALSVNTILSFEDDLNPVCRYSHALTRGPTSIRFLSNLLQSGGSSPDNLMEVSLPIVTNAQCAQIYGSSSITNSMLCAGYVAGGKDSCQGDSGGPLVSGGVQVGIVSWGGECAAVGIAGVYVRVSAIRDWVFTNTGI